MGTEKCSLALNILKKRELCKDYDKYCTLVLKKRCRLSSIETRGSYEIVRRKES